MMVANLFELDAIGIGMKASALPLNGDGAPPTPKHSTVDLAAGALSSLPTAIIVLNDCNNIVYANDTAQRLVDSNASSPDFAASGDFSFITPADPSRIIGTHISKLGLAVFSPDRRRLQALCGTASSVVQRAAHTQLKRFRDNSYHICDRDTNPESSIFCSAPLDFQVWTADNDERFLTLSFDLPFAPNRLPVSEIPTPHEIPKQERKDSNVSLLQERTTSETRRGYERDFARYAQHIFLKDANGRSGYFVSADESVVVCNYRGGAREVHHPKRLEEFIVTQWTIYDTGFVQRISVDDFPFVKYTRERTEYKTQYGYPTVEGERMILDVEGYPLYASDGEYLGSASWVKVLGSYEDFHSDQDLEKLHSHETVLELLPHYTWTVTPAWGIEFFSKSWCEYTGIGDPYRQGWKRAIHPEDIQGLMDQVARCTLNREIVKTHVRYKRWDGVWRWCAFAASPLTNGRGEIIKWFGSTTDIHESWMEYREQFQWSSRVLSTLSSVPINLFATDGNGKLILIEGGLGIPPWNERFNKDTVSHGSLQLMLGINLVDWMLCHHDPAGLPQLIRECLSGVRETGEVEELVKGTWIKTTVKAHIKTMPDGEKVVDQVVGCTVDITEAKALRDMERENAKMLVEKNTALESNRLQSQFLASVSHELRTPIAGIMGMSSLLADMDGRTAEELDFVDGIKTSAARLLTLVNDLLDHSKIEAGRFEVERVPFDVHDVFKATVQAFKHSIEQKGIKFEYGLDIPSSLTILGDSLRLSQVLANGFSNAVKFSHQNGSIHFSASLCFGGDTDVVKFTIKDTGIGITPEVLQTLFVPFKQGDSSTSRVYGGTGLGLTISKSLTELMGGTLELISVANEGTMMIVTIPAVPATLALDVLPSTLGRRSNSPQDDFNHQYAREGISSPLQTVPPSRHSPPTPPPPQPLRILIAEDNAINAKIAIKTVKKLGYETVHCWNGQQALDYLIDDSNLPVDLILMDCQMPVLDGYAATEALRKEKLYTSKKRLDGLPVVALTASAIKGDKEKALASGMDFYMMKPFTKERLDEVLKIWLRKKREVRNREVCGEETEHRPRMLERNTVG